jgi:hypothetical protein
MMSSSFLFQACLALLLSPYLANQDNDADDECSLYLAESSVKNAGWGVFAGKDFTPGEKVGEPGVGVHVMDTYNVQDDGALSEFIK